MRFEERCEKSRKNYVRLYILSKFIHLILFLALNFTCIWFMWNGDVIIKNPITDHVLTRTIYIIVSTFVTFGLSKFASYLLCIFPLINLNPGWRKRNVRSLFESLKKAKMPKKLPKVLILYPTCDDWCEFCATRAHKQNYENAELFILDDSRDPKFMHKIDTWANKHNVTVVRRENRAYWKCGNLNHFLNEYVKRKKISFDYFVVMDADTLLPPEFVSANIPFFYGIKNLALIQSTPTAYDTKSLLSRIGKERLAEWPKIVDNQFTQGYSNYFGWGGIFDIKIFRKKIKSFYEVVNEDTSVAYCYTLKNCKSIVSPIAPHSSMEPHDLISFWVRDKRWCLSQVDFYAKFKSRCFTSKNNRNIKNFFFFNSYPVNGFFYIMYSVVFGSLIIPLFFCFNFETFQGLHNLIPILFSSTLVLLGITCLLSFITRWIKSRKFLASCKNFLIWFIVLAMYNLLSYLVVFHHIKSLFKINLKSRFNRTNKTFQKITWKYFWDTQKYKLLVCFILIVLAVVFILLPKTNFNFLPLFISLCINIGFFFVLFASMALSNILIKKNTYEYDILNRYNDIRKEYGYEQLPITIEPLKWEN